MDNRVSWGCSVCFATPNYQEALLSCAHERKIIRTGGPPRTPVRLTHVKIGKRTASQLVV